MASGQSGEQRLPFDLKCYVCSHVFTGSRDILLVTRPDGDWCFMCGADDHPDDASALRVVGFGHMIDRDASVADVLDLEPDEEADRTSRGGDWVRTRF